MSPAEDEEPMPKKMTPSRGRVSRRYGRGITNSPGGKSEKSERRKTSKPRSGQGKLQPTIPLRDIIVFPGMVVPLIIGRQKTINAVEEAQSFGDQVILAFQRDPHVDDPGPGDIIPVAVQSKILQVARQPEGQVKLLAEVTGRVRVTGVFPEKRFFAVSTEPFTTDHDGGPEEEALMRLLVESLENYLQLNPIIPREALGNLLVLQDPERLVDMVAGSLPLNREKKEALLLEPELAARLRLILKYMKDEIEVLNVQRQIQGEVFKKIEKTQRDYILQEQMKTIQQELGRETEDSEIKNLRKSIENAGMPDPVRKKALDELNRLTRMMQMSPEATVIRNYLDWMVNLPWRKTTRDHLDVRKAETILEEDHYGLEKAKERILEYLAVRKRSGSLRGPIICFVGPPGSGKTSLGRSVARSLGRQFTRMSLGGIRDEAEIRGHRRTYIGSMPGRIIQSFRKVGVRNPVFLLDEIDKIGVDFRGDPTSALLEVLDPEQNNSFNDHYLEVDFDLSQVLFITTANNESGIPEPLLDRMEIIYLPGYTHSEKLEIARRYLVPREIKANGIKAREVAFSDEALTDIIRFHTREAGVRTLQRQIASVCRKIVKEQEKAGKRSSVKVSRPRVARYLGVPQYRAEEAELVPRVGVVTGLAWTEYGGDVLFTEVIALKGKGEPMITGRLGDIMKESCRIALSLVRLHSNSLGIDPDFHRKTSLHIHVPSGAVPKDGPSAGVTMVTAIASCLSGRAVPGDIAMTGEITLRGRVMPVGGLRAKLLAAGRAGVRTVLIPRDNEKDITEIPKREITGLKIIPVGEVSEIFRHVFGP